MKMSNGSSGCLEDELELNKGKSYLLLTYFKSVYLCVVLYFDFSQIPRCKLALPPTVNEARIPQTVTNVYM